MGFEPIYPVLQTGASVPSWLIDIKRRELDLHQNRFYPATCVPNRCRPYPDRHPPNYYSIVHSLFLASRSAWRSLWCCFLWQFAHRTMHLSISSITRLNVRFWLTAFATSNFFWLGSRW